jgi:hypothetical protein
MSNWCLSDFLWNTDKIITIFTNKKIIVNHINLRRLRSIFEMALFTVHIVYTCYCKFCLVFLVCWKKWSLFKNHFILTPYTNLF